MEKIDEIDEIDELKEATAIFEAYLASYNLKLTEERKKVLQEVLSTRAHLNADELHLKLQLEGSGISKATVYRTLELLTESGIIRKLKLFGDRHAYYEPSNFKAQGYHYHLVCEVCGRISEFANLQIEQRLKKVCHEFGFTPEDFNLIIYGRCQECDKRRKAEGET